MDEGKRLSRAYRLAFAEFSAKVRRVQDVKSQPVVDRAALDVALQDVEAARVNYRACRDALAASLLQPAATSKTEDPICVSTAA